MKTITIVGIGALGSHAALFLRNQGHLRVVDFDVVEPKNVLAQQHTKQAIGKKKVSLFAQTLAHAHGAVVSAFTAKLTVDNARELLGKPDLVIDCTDNYVARVTMQSWCKANNVPLLHGAMSADGMFARVVWTEDFKPDLEDGTGATCEDGENLPLHGLYGGHIAWVAQQFLKTGKKMSTQMVSQRIA